MIASLLIPRACDDFLLLSRALLVEQKVDCVDNVGRAMKSVNVLLHVQKAELEKHAESGMAGSNIAHGLRGRGDFSQMMLRLDLTDVVHQITSSVGRV